METRLLIIRTVIASTAFFFLLCSYYIIQPTRTTILWEHMGMRHFHWFYFWNAFITFFSVLVYNHASSKYSRAVFMRLIFSSVIVAFLIFWLLFYMYAPPQIPNQSNHLNAGWGLKILASIYHFFVCIYIIVFTSIFWSINHETSKVPSAKLIYPYIFLGGQLGVIVGSRFTFAFGKKIGLYNLLLWCLLGVCLCWVIMELLLKFSPKQEQLPKTSTFKDFAIFQKNKYALFIAILVIFGTYAITICDYQYKTLLESQIPGSSDRTTFLAQNNEIMGYGNILMTTIITPLLLHTLGAAVAISIFPMVVIAICIFFWYGMDINTAAWFAIVVSCLNYTLYQVGKETFYVPTDMLLKYKTKAFCDMFGYRMGEGLGSMTMTLYLLVLPNLVFGLSWIVIISCVIWLFSLRRMDFLYKEQLQTSGNPTESHNFSTKNT